MTNENHFQQLGLNLAELNSTRLFPNLETLMSVIKADHINTARFYHFRLVLILVDTTTGDTMEYAVNPSYKNMGMAEGLKELSMLVQYLRSLDMFPGFDLRIRMDGWQPEAITETHLTGWTEFLSKTV